MRILIVTQKIDQNDAVLGFMHGWIAEFAGQAESVTAICLEKGSVNLPKNVTVLSLGKGRFTIFRRAVYVFRFWRYIWVERSNYDSVFVHMNPEYVVLGGIFWKLWGKTVTLWYAHKSVTWHLRIAKFFADIIFTSTASGFRLSSAKVKVIGQGIDTEKFKSQKEKVKSGDGEFKIVTVGRISPSKDYDTLINAVEYLSGGNDNLKIKVGIWGPTGSASDESYLTLLKEKIVQKKLSEVVVFHGPVANKDLPEVLGSADLFVNMGHTGSLDKAVVEAMACGLPVLTCNEAFKDVLGPYKDELMYPKGDSRAFAMKIKDIVDMASEKRKELGESLRGIVVRDHSLESFVRKIISAIKLFQTNAK